MSDQTVKTTRLAAIAAVALLAAGCATHDSVKVGSIPDDYRTNHPIVIGERDKTIDIPVGVADRGMTRVQRVALDGFIADYDRKAAPIVGIMVPHGSGNEAAASAVAADFVGRLRKAGVPEGRILHQPYDAARYGDSAPIRLSYAEMRASTGPCGRWPADMMENSENKHWANFGCSYQNNLAAQIANPADLLGPRQRGDIDAQNRSHAIDQYRDRAISGDMRGDREVNY
jgi:pilus assembly protein CpaD